MKKLLLCFMLCLSLPVLAGGSGTDIDVNAQAQAEALALVKSYQDNTTNWLGRVEHSVPSAQQNCVGRVCKATNALVITGQYDEVTGNSINVGVLIPFGGGGKTTKSAMNTEAQILATELLHTKEKHQAEMAEICMALHKLVVLRGPGSAELFTRCEDFIHHIGANGAHAGHGHPQQVSPH